MFDFQENTLSPKGLQKKLPKMRKRQKCLNSIDFTIVFNMSTCKFDAKNTPDAFKHVPGLF